MTSDRVSVLEVITSLAGGAGLHAYHLARHVDPSRFDVRLAFGAGYPLDDRVAREGLPHDRVGWSRRLGPASIARGAADLARVLRRTRVDVLHAHCSLAGVVARVVAAHVTRPRVVFTVHAFASRDHQPAWRRRLYLAVERGMDRYTDRYCVTTRAYRDALIARGITTADRIDVVPLGIEVGARPAPADRAAARRDLGLRPGDLAVVASGRLEKQKGLTYLLRAFGDLRRRQPAARLVIIGDGPLRGALEHETAQRGLDDIVRFTGWRHDAARLIAGADAFCLSSLWESFSYALLEAMAAGVPIAATRLDVTPEVVEDGRDALLVPPADADALAEALATLLGDRDRRQALADAGRHHVERRFPLARMLEAHEALYGALAGRAMPATVAA